MIGGRLSRQSRLAAILFVLAGMALVVWPSVMDGRVPGDLGDARFNSYILEHFHRWLAGRDHSFWNADFYYPFPLTIALSDNFLGDGVAYSLFRVVGLGREDAFRAWFALGFALNFASAYHALYRLGYSRLAAAAGAFLFAFGLPITAQEGHAQLIYRFGVPMAFLALVEFDRDRAPRQLVFAAFWTVWQFFCSIYIGFFLVLLLAAFALARILCWRPTGPPDGQFAGWRTLPGELWGAWQRRSAGERAVFLGSLAILAALMVVLGAPYRAVTKIYGIDRSWLEISSMMPQPASYLLSTNSRIWPSSGPLYDGLAMRHEHGMFTGIAPLLAIAAGTILRWTRRATPDRLFAQVALAILFVVSLTLFFHGLSAYRLVLLVPGASAVRAVTRIGTVLLFPWAILLASSLDAVLTARLARAGRLGGAALLLGLLVFESAFISHLTTGPAEWRARMAALANMLPPQLPESPILLLAPAPPPTPRFLRELDAMLFAQDRGWRSINGYSGSAPPGYKIAGVCQDGPRNLMLGLAAQGRSSETAYLALSRDVVRLGYPACDPAELLRPPVVRPFPGPVSASLIAGVRLSIGGLALRDGLVVAAATITNLSSETLPADSSTGTPLRLSARYVDPATPEPTLLRGLAWDLRQDLTLDIPPGRTDQVEIPMAPPPAPGTYRVAISMVQEGVVWLHDRGMTIPLSTQTVIVEGSGGIRIAGAPP